ncbi:DUF6894 family protein [Methylobacterium nigriterrae]|uniref:DUF6894 family protein n=1 Tax=Methylobacterium nigriterrae TaxID=3127512 RepID=UPI0030136D76
MPRYFFHLRTVAGLQRDEEGLEFAGLEPAYLDACRAIPDMTADLMRKGQAPASSTFEITDDAGRLLMEVPFSEILGKGQKPRRPLSPALTRKAQAERERTRRLIASLGEQKKALQATLTETQVLVARLRGRGP